MCTQVWIYFSEFGESTTIANSSGATKTLNKETIESIELSPDERLGHPNDTFSLVFEDF
jgi:hypothetical protein